MVLSFGPGDSALRKLLRLGLHHYRLISSRDDCHPLLQQEGLDDIMNKQYGRTSTLSQFKVSLVIQAIIGFAFEEGHHDVVCMDLQDRVAWSMYEEPITILVRLTVPVIDLAFDVRGQVVDVISSKHEILPLVRRLLFSSK
jgi:hypothetical protein